MVKRVMHSRYASVCTAKEPIAVASYLDVVGAGNLLLQTKDPSYHNTSGYAPSKEQNWVVVY